MKLQNLEHNCLEKLITCSWQFVLEEEEDDIVNILLYSYERVFHMLWWSQTLCWSSTSTTVLTWRTLNLTPVDCWITTVSMWETITQKYY